MDIMDFMDFMDFRLRDKFQTKALLLLVLIILIGFMGVQLQLLEMTVCRELNQNLFKLL